MRKGEFRRKGDPGDGTSGSFAEVVLGLRGFVFEEVGDLAVEGGAESGEGGEADGGDVIVFDFGEVDVGDADLVGEVV